MTTYFDNGCALVYRKKLRAVLSIFKSLILVAFIICHSSWGCGLQGAPAAGPLDGVDNGGHGLLLLQLMRDISISKNINIGVWLKFSTQNVMKGIFGNYWSCPLLESRIVQIDDNSFLLYQPDGPEVTLVRDQHDSNIIKGGGWIGMLNKNRISLKASCGWSLEFINGKIASIDNANGEHLSYNYVAERLKSISLNGKAVIEVMERQNDSGRKVVVNYGDEVATVDLQSLLPPVDQLGRLRNSTEAINSIIVNGEKTKLNWNFDGANSSVKLLPPDNVEQDLVWDSTTGLTKKYNDWNYKTGESSTSLGSYNVSREKSTPPYFQESVFRDVSAGTVSTRRFSGDTIITKIFMSGPAEGKVRYVKRIGADNKEVFDEQRNYDNLGRISRIINKSGQFVFNYDGEKTQITINCIGKSTITLLYRSGVLESVVYNGKNISSSYFSQLNPYIDAIKECIYVDHKPNKNKP